MLKIDATKALGAVRYFRARAVARDDIDGAAGWVAGQGWIGVDDVLELVQRAGASAVTDAELRGRNPVLTDLAGEVRNASILGNLPGVVRMPFMSATIGLGGAARAHWVAPGKAVPVSPIAIGEPALLDGRTVGALLIARNKLLREASPMAERALADELIRATAEAYDRALVDVGNAGSGDAPAAITYGGFKTGSTGSSLAQIDNDLGGLAEELAGEDLSTARWVLHPRTAAFLARLRGTGGALAYPGIGVNGGELLGIPALVSAGVPVDDDTAAETQISLLIGSGIVVAGAEQLELLTSTQGSIEMDTAPTGDAATPTAASKHLVSMFQSECTALMAIGHANWKARRATVAATLTGVAY